MKKEYLTYK